MELRIAVPELAKALHRVQGVVEKKTTMPILANVLIETKGSNAIAISATNLEIGVTGTYNAEVLTQGAITIAGKALYDIVRSLPPTNVLLKRTANNWIEIACGKVSYKVVGMAAEGFPSLPRFDDVAFFGIAPKIFKEMIDKTLYSVSTDETRYNLTGVYCEPLGGPQPGLRMVSTDGHRLSIVERTLDHAPTMKKGVILPRRGVVELRKLLEDGEGETRLGFVENSTVFERGGITLTMQLLEGQFPDYQQVIPASFGRRAVVGKVPFLDALRRTSLLSPDKAQGVRLDLTNGALALSANNPDLGEAREEIEAQYEGEQLKIGFNFRYLIDALGVLSEDQVEIQLTDSLSPGVLLGVGTPGYRAIIMPMRL